MKPHLRLKPFVMDAELVAAESTLGLKGLTKAVVEAYADYRESRKEPVDRDEALSLLRFIAVSTYLNREESRITPWIQKILSFGTENQKKEGLDAFLAEIFKGWAPPPYTTEDRDAMLANRKTGKMFLQEGLTILSRMTRQHGEVGPETAALVAGELAPHANNMEAKGYSRWVHTLQQQQKQGVQAGKTVTIPFNGSLPLQIQDGHGWQQMRWAAYDLDEKGESTYMEELPLKKGKEYRFVPPPSLRKRTFDGRVLVIDGTNEELVIEVLKEVG
jgi:hypothetical protein